MLKMYNLLHIFFAELRANIDIIAGFSQGDGYSMCGVQLL